MISRSNKKSNQNKKVVKITEEITKEVKKTGPGVYFCEYCQTYCNVNRTPEKKFIKWTLCDLCYMKHYIDPSVRAKRKEARKKKREIKKANAPFDIYLDNAKDLKYIIEALSSNLDDKVRITLSSEGFSIIAMDSARIHLLIITLTPEYFNKFEYTYENQFFCIKIDDLNTIFQKIPDESTIHLSTIIDKIYTKSDHLPFLLIKTNRMKHELIRSDLDEEDYPTEKLLAIEHSCKLTLDAGEFFNILESAFIHSELIRFQANNSEIEFISEGQIGKFIYTHQLIEPSKKPADAWFSIPYMKNFLKPIVSVLETVEIHIKTDNPLKIKIPLRNNSNLQIYLAPRVEDPDDD